MSYDFTTLWPPYGTEEPMWQRLRAHGEPRPDDVELEVAEMKFRIPPEITEACVTQARQGTFGYGGASDALRQSIVRWMEQRHGWQVRPEWIAQTYGLVSAIGYAVRSLTAPGDGVLVNFPAYRPFPTTVERNGRRLVRSDLTLRGGRYQMDWEDMERKLSDPSVTAYILCNPHNPTGRVWTRQELTAVGELCLRHGVKVISDEIHFDITYPGHPQTVFASLGGEMAENAVILTAPSKSFNIAGMTVSNVIVPGEALRRRVWDTLETDMGHYINAFGFAACAAAYDRCAPWLEECLTVLKGNCDYLREFLARRVPVFSCREQEGTYLVWMDCTASGLSGEALDRFLWEDARFFSEPGGIFGAGYESFHRVNAACPRAYLEGACLRLEAAAKARGLI
jgi:cystathionine beta-lyase